MIALCKDKAKQELCKEEYMQKRKEKCHLNELLRNVFIYKE